MPRNCNLDKNEPLRHVKKYIEDSVDLDVVFVHKGEYMTVYLNDIAVELHVDTNGIPRIVMNESDKEHVYTYKEIYGE